MDGLSSVQTLQALSSLLAKPDADDDEDDSLAAQASAKLGPGNIGPSSGKLNTASSVYTKQNCKAIWDEDEVAEGAQFDDLTDQRPEPEYEIILKQSVGTEDLFLGMSRKDPSSMCCEGMLR